MKRKNLIAAALLACIGISAKAQDVKIEEPKGKAIVQTFGNFNVNFGADNSRGFDLERTYLGYEYKLAYIKNAMLSWKKGNMTLNGGLISTTQFNFQEKFWGYRYIMKSFQDQYKFGSSADLGLSVAYKFADWISADAIVVNGEGYKKIQKDNGLNYGLGLTLTPVKGFQIRLYGGLNASAEENKEDIINIAAFAGYKNDRFTVGAEYNHMMNASYKKGNDQYGYSVFASMKVAKNTEVYARFDDLYSNDEWNIAKDEQTAIVGAQFKLGKYVKLAPNFRMAMPKAEGSDNTYAAFINCYFGL